ncbi:MAG: ATP-dependent DNA helicase RecG [Salinisphaera sp.]|nr:ATP-dependent DNA helicase RecG [Salinisphaera sp.]
MRANDPVTGLRGVGPALAARLEQLSIHLVADLLWHKPLRYEDRTRILPLAQLHAGAAALVAGRIDAAEQRRTHRRSLVVLLDDGSGALVLRFFHFAERQVQGLRPGAWLRAFGEVRAGPEGLEMVHPEYRLVADRTAAERVAPTLTPVYPAVAGISQQRLRALVAPLLAALEEPEFLPDCLPTELLREQGMPTLASALRSLHAPPPETDPAALMEARPPAQRRLAFEEMLAHQPTMRQRRPRIRACTAPAMAPGSATLRAYVAGLGFVLTGAQRRVVGEITADLAHTAPMLRLVQGDVGSGKTAVAAAAAVTAAAAGWQTALMAPTELLAEQHYQTLAQWLEPLGIGLWLLTAATGGGADGKAARQAIAAGQVGVIVGTHALFQQATDFGRLGLTIIDEQHRFGVHQRLSLRDKGAAADVLPHQLIMTATPIPRSLAMSLYGDMDTSLIDELPPNRTPVVTVAVPDSRREEVVARIQAACAAGRQAYWVCTLIDESQSLEARAAEATAEDLAQALPELRIGLAHGRMKGRDKDRVMRSFKAGTLDVLVATTVIEVGVDVPRASLMVIENAERLGLSQLHQLRGRVGRGGEQSHCVLLYSRPLGALARKRLAALRATGDGFVIAREDLALRGPGEVFGTRQTGAVEFKFADVLRDADLLPAAQDAADRLLACHPEAAATLIARWLGEEVDRYAEV